MDVETYISKLHWILPNTEINHMCQRTRVKEHQSCLWPTFYQINFMKGNIMLVKKDLYNMYNVQFVKMSANQWLLVNR